MNTVISTHANDRRRVQPHPSAVPLLTFLVTICAVLLPPTRGSRLDDERHPRCAIGQPSGFAANRSRRFRRRHRRVAGQA